MIADDHAVRQEPIMPSPNTAEIRPHDAAWYVDAMERLVGVVRELSRARSVDAVTAIVREAARGLTGADGATFVLRDGDQCFYADENAITPLWKGKRFPMSECLSGWVMQHGEAVVIEDVYSDPRVPVEAYRPTFVKSMAMVPIRRNAPIGAIGNYWASRHTATAHEVTILQALADTTSVALENAELDGQLRGQLRAMREQQIRIQEQRDTLEVFTRAMAHDLKEPVRTMKSFSQMVLESDNIIDEQRQHLHFVHSGAERMSLLIDSVLRYMQLDDPSRVSVVSCPMTQIVQEACENLSQLIMERSTVVSSDALPAVQGDHVHLVQVMQNLIANAIVHNDSPITVRVAAHKQGDTWVFSVCDNGVGIPPEHAQRIFKPFKRLSTLNEGAGLGLAICEKAIVRCGGTIWCEPRPGSGATFCFALPQAAKEASVYTEPAPPEGDASEHSTACILLVDDRPADLMLTRLMLSKKASLKCRLLTAQNGEEALAILRREPVDLVLLDINMPGLDGFDVLDQVRRDKALSHITVVMCTGSEYELDKERARSLGAAGYLLKPPSFAALRPLLERIPTLQLSPQADGIALQRVVIAAA